MTQTELPKIKWYEDEEIVDKFAIPLLCFLLGFGICMTSELLLT